MSASISRRRLAVAVVDRLQSQSRKKVLQELAAYIVEERLMRQIDLIVSDIEAEFAVRGQIVANVTSARALDKTSRDELTQFIADQLKARSVELREDVDAELIGGVVIQTPGKYFDSSLSHHLQQLNNARI